MEFKLLADSSAKSGMRIISKQSKKEFHPVIKERNSWKTQWVFQMPQDEEVK